MTGLTIAAMWVAGFVLYGAIGTFVGLRSVPVRSERYWIFHDLSKCQERRGYCRHEEPDEDSAFILGALWPVGMWVLIGMYFLLRQERTLVKDRERKRLLEEALKELDA